MDKYRTKAERRVDSLAKELREHEARVPPDRIAIAKARRRLEIAWRTVNQQREQLRARRYDR